MEIRELLSADLEKIKPMYREVFGGPPWNEDWEDDRQLEEYLLDLTEVRGSLHYGLFESGRILGFSLGKIKHWCEGTEYYIEDVCIRPEDQGKGYGRIFFSMIEQDLVSRGVRTIYLMTDRDQPAYEFYRKLGFTELPEVTSFYKEF